MRGDNFDSSPIFRVGIFSTFFSDIFVGGLRLFSFRLCAEATGHSRYAMREYVSQRQRKY